ncbi:MAG: DUF2961 domain-containing protein [Planctomycetes bacterium]|nr:DUF2961 domain-containing protein [Planctomycetota bacterium]
MSTFDGLSVDMSSLHRLSNAKSRSISAENFTGEKGKAGMATEGNGASCARNLGRGWKVSPSVPIAPGATFTLADIKGPGAIQSIWMAGQYHPRFNILRIYWDDQEQPSVECPVGDFFCNGWGKYAQLTSLAVCMNPGRGAFNCYWTMPFRKRARITITNIHTEPMTWYYQINYALGPVSDDAAYFHAQFRRVNPLQYKKVYTIVDGIKGKGHYAGTYMAWGVNNNGWWGEGEIKFYLDGDCPPGKDVAEHGGDAFPTICGTGTEDYFCGCYNFDIPGKGYQEYCTPYAGMFQVIRPDGLYVANTRFGMYRWHIPDPVRFDTDLKITIQAIGWRSEGRYLANQDDIASVAFWYQTLPTAPFPKLPSRDELEVI